MFIRNSFKVLAALGCLCFGNPAAAQDSAASSSRYFEVQPFVVSAHGLQSGQTRIELWGLEALPETNGILYARSRLYLEYLIGSEKIRCELKARQGDVLYALCNNGSLDLGLEMIQQGYALANRAALYGTKYDAPYKDAEANARGNELGVWQIQSAGAVSGTSNQTLIVLGAILVFCILGIFAALSLIIMKGFQKVIDAQNQNMDMISRERALKDKERGIVAGMIDSELKVNKSKIEAYLVVYEEMLRTLKDPSRSPKYKKAGDIIQAQPALERAVFDRNTDKMDALGDRLASEVIHYYARIKTTPEYINIDPSMDVDEVVALVEKSLRHARRLEELVERLIQNFSRAGYSSEGSRS